jgi:RNA polymerase sigma-70 factor (ECF subfamily)
VTETLDRLNELSDELLVERVTAGDVAAFAVIFDRYARPIYALAAHMLGPAEADEVVQEVFLRLWQRVHQFDPARGSLRVWLMAVARHRTLDLLKQRSQEQRVLAVDEIERLLAQLPAADLDMVELVWSRQRSAAMHQALRDLPAEQRRAILLAYFGGFSQSELAALLGWPLGTVKKRVRLALQKLRRFLVQWDEVG